MTVFDTLQMFAPALNEAVGTEDFAAVMSDIAEVYHVIFNGFPENEQINQGDGE